MMPVNTVNNYTIQPPLVNTTTPGTTVTHVPYDNVAPSVSSAQVDNNARGNSAPASPSAAEQAAAAVQNQVDTPAVSAAPFSATPGAPSVAAQATFIAQLAGQDSSPETQGILVQYEKLVNLSNVKYLPSNAARPEAQPSDVFGRLVQSERAAPQAQQAPPPPVSAPAPAATAEAVTVVSSITASETILAQQRNSKPSTSAAEPAAAVSTSSESTPASAPAAPPPPAISAYIATASRITSQALENTTEIV